MKSVYVDIQHLEEAFGVDLHGLKQGDPMSKLFEALGDRPRFVQENSIVGRTVDITILDDPCIKGTLDSEKKEKLLAWHRTYLRNQDRIKSGGKKETTKWALDI